MPHAAGHRTVLATFVLLAMGAGTHPALGGPVFTAPVTVDGQLVGTFAIDSFEPSGDAASFGVSILGGFNASPGYAPPSGYEYRWIQTVTSNLPAYSWQSPDVAYVDRTRERDANGNYTLARSNTPFYADGVVVPGTPHDLQFADNPSRELGPSEFHGSWALSLVLAQPPVAAGAPFNQPEPGVIRALHQLATFVWGYDAWKQADGSMKIDLRAIQQIPPDPALLAGIFASDPDQGTFGGGAWDIRSGLPGSTPVIPEPSSLLLAASGLVAAIAPIRLARRRAAS